MKKLQRDSEATSAPRPACELKRKVAALAVAALLAATAAIDTHASIQEPDSHAAQAEHAEAGEHAAASWSALFWPTVNFIILAGVLYYFLKTPLVTYLADRHAGIRKDLKEAAELKSSADLQLAEIDRKLKALPGELTALKQRGSEDVAAEEQRIAREAAAERDRLLEQARLEIQFQVRIAKREILEHAADVAVAMAADRIKTTMTPDDQNRLVDQYLDQLKPTERH
jgi:F-type H+-transporting ATPase subunit b